MKDIGVYINQKLYSCKIKNNISNNIDILVDMIEHIDDDFDFFKKNLNHINVIDKSKIEDYVEYWNDFSSIFESGFFIESNYNNMDHLIDIDNNVILYEKKQYPLNKDTLIYLLSKKFFETLLK